MKRWAALALLAAAKRRDAPGQAYVLASRRDVGGVFHMRPTLECSANFPIFCLSTFGSISGCPLTLAGLPFEACFWALCVQQKR